MNYTNKGINLRTGGREKRIKGRELIKKIIKTIIGELDKETDKEKKVKKI